MINIIFSFFGLAVGIFSLGFLLITFNKGPEALKIPTKRLILGVVFIVFSFIWDLIIHFVNNDILEIHHLLMAASVLFFADAAQKLYKLGR